MPWGSHLSDNVEDIKNHAFSRRGGITQEPATAMKGVLDTGDKGLRVKRKFKEIKTMSHPLLAWKYECHCGLVAYNFDHYQQAIQATCGHDLGWPIRVIYFQKKFMDHCSICNQSARAHGGERRDEMFYEATCPTKEKIENGIN